MKILLAIIVIAGIVGLLFFLLRRGTSSGSLAGPEQTHESVVITEQIPDVVAKLQREGRDSSFAVFMFEPLTGEPSGEAVNLQYSIDKGVIGLDWVLLSPRNIADKEALSAFITSSGHSVSTHEMNDVKYLRVEGSGISELGVKICRDFYHSPPNAKMDLIVEGFEWQPRFTQR